MIGSLGPEHVDSDLQWQKASKLGGSLTPIRYKVVSFTTFPLRSFVLAGGWVLGRRPCSYCIIKEHGCLLLSSLSELASFSMGV